MKVEVGEGPSQCAEEGSGATEGRRGEDVELVRSTHRRLFLWIIGEDDAKLCDARRFLVGRRAPAPTPATGEAGWDVQSASSVREY